MLVSPLEQEFQDLVSLNFVSWTVSPVEVGVTMHIIGISSISEVQMVRA